MKMHKKIQPMIKLKANDPIIRNNPLLFECEIFNTRKILQICIIQYVENVFQS